MSKVRKISRKGQIIFSGGYYPCKKKAVYEINSLFYKIDNVIRAEIVTYDKLIECGSEAAAKEKGYYRLEGKEYVMRDGDIVNFRFNV